ncbi:AraC family transcriptional regulator [Mycobacterium sp. CBMA293]|uniref:AraC family transcriptional regulator n=1 Tax=unclassified Mycolicibacterium TaxID=2636767 RepID=UPI0012DD41FC|nr:MULTISPECIES: AraC family transcriptional regulator [unclassified Mycolicibacterium]MUL46650.1 AraC family transcriptional regulator [Mycolicibacterium sp. CBMA 360]MUL59049.1 AraC family transcriptional regulator [Mycolicibacterium sp. CBMA 335]MUL69443.1 AraC family transcriptional regulator [Mycolicibacterium sp. CBMA 311]MUL94407.1 AraC family transcriptional regulator [Mycolicibacterium sp. CBMA 230]MUM06576.1 AraC family transcriptional regulator [Mycolicibacterium sp. CBMA 213]
MSVVRGTSLSNYAPLVHELGGDPLELMRLAGIRPQDVGRYDLFMPLRSVVAAVESAAIVTTTPDFGRRLAQRQGIEILGPVGVAARTAATVADAFTIFENYMAAYSPAISATFTPLDDPARAFFEFRLLLEGSPPMPQSIELTLGVALRVLRLMISTNYAPLDVYIPHQPLTTADDYRHYFGCTPRFAARTAGFTLRTTDLAQPLNHDQLANQAVVQYLKLITARDSGFAASAQTMVRQLLPTGAVTLELIAAQFNMHPRALQRRLTDEGAPFRELLDDVRKRTAEHYLRDTEMTLSHLSRELGYAEQSVLTRSCRRWFGTGPAEYRRAVQRDATKPIVPLSDTAPDRAR